jgi:very-long-chain enoyl-CoA reductase
LELLQSSSVSKPLTDRSLSRAAAPKQPIKKLPPSIEVSANTTVEDLKILVARQAGIKDHNRIGLFDPAAKKTLKNRKAAIGSENAVVAAGEVLVKDLGGCVLAGSSIVLSPTCRGTARRS